MAKKFSNPMSGSGIRAPLRDYTKRNLGKPLLQQKPFGMTTGPLMRTRDYSKLSPISLTDLEGPLTLEKSPRPFRPKF